MSRKRIEVKAGERFGRWTVLREAPLNKGHVRFYCKCDCGNMLPVRASALKAGTTQSCGCLQKEIAAKTSTKHGSSMTKLYRVWQSMKCRCFGKKNASYKNYGGRGIVVCKEWLEYKIFHEWAISSGYRVGLTIERIDNNGDYCPDNCEWIPRSEQPKNSRQCVPVTVSGINFYSIAEAVRYFHVARTLFRSRLRRGLSIKQALGL